MQTVEVASALKYKFLPHRSGSEFTSDPLSHSLIRVHDEYAPALSFFDVASAGVVSKMHEKLTYGGHKITSSEAAPHPHIHMLLQP